MKVQHSQKEIKLPKKIKKLLYTEYLLCAKHWPGAVYTLAHLILTIPSEVGNITLLT